MDWPHLNKREKDISRTFWITWIHRQMITGAVFIVLKKTFDLVDHECILYKLEQSGERGSSVDWFWNYLTTRTHFGKEQAIQFGVPMNLRLTRLLAFCNKSFAAKSKERAHGTSDR